MYKKYLSAFILVFVFAFLPLGVAADHCGHPSEEIRRACEEQHRQEEVSKTNTGELGSADDLNIPTVTADDTLLQRLLGTAFVIIGIVSVLFVVIGGFRYVISGGDPGKTQQAKNTIIYALAGLVISILAVSIINFVLGRL